MRMSVGTGSDRVVRMARMLVSWHVDGMVRR